MKLQDGTLHFHAMSQHLGQPLSEYIEQFRAQANKCHSESFVALVDQLIFGMHNTNLPKRLLSREKITLKTLYR